MNGSAGDRRAQLAVAAYEVVAESGIDKLSLRTVARRLGATTGLVSHHFRNRSDLLAAALDHAAATMFERVRRVPDGSDAFELLAAVLPTDESSREVWRFSLSVRVSGLFDTELQRFDRTMRAHWEDNADRITDPAMSDRSEAARHLVALVDGIALNAVLDPDKWPPQRQRAHLRAGFRALETGALAPAG